MNNTIPLCKIADRPVAPREIGAYVSALINQPWARDGRHCWRLVREVQRDLFGRDLPVVLATAPPPGKAGRRLRAQLFGEHDERAHWREVETPEHGAIALMRRSAAPEGFFIHAGVFLQLDGGGVLHTAEPHGIVFDGPSELAARLWVPTYLIPNS